MRGFGRSPQVALFIGGIFLVLALLVFGIRGFGLLVLRGKLRTRWENAFDDLGEFLQSRDGWVAIMLTILMLGVVIGIVITVLYE